MATKRIKDLTNTATSVASDSYLAIDGTSNGTEKITRDNFRQDTADAFVAAPGTYNLAPLSGGAVEVAKGGTGSTTAAGARTNLEVNSKDEDAQANALKVTAPALYFNGTSSVVTVADDAKFSFTDGSNPTGFGFGGWVKLDPTWSADGCIVSKDDSTNREWRLGFDENGANDSLRVFLFDSGGSTNYSIYTALVGGELLEGQWQHVFFTYDPDTGDGVLYQNGVALSTAKADTGSGFSNFSNTIAPVRIGKAASTIYFKGSIRDVKIFNRTLTSTEIAELARGNDLGFADEWAGALGGVYTSDFSAGADGFLQTNGTVAGNVDGVGGQDDNLRFTVDTSSAVHRAYKTGVKSVGKRYRVAFDYYIPSGQSNVDNIRVTETNGTDILADNLNVTDAWTRATFESVATTNGFYFYAKDGISTTFQDAGGDDIFYIRNVTITEIGTLADFRSERYDTSTSKLYDISDNAFVGTGTNVSLTGREVPVYEHGTWSPTVEFGGASSGTYSVQEGGYSRLGNTVQVWGQVNHSSKSAATGSATIEGLPYSSAASSNTPFGGVVGMTNAANLTSQVICLIGGSSTSMGLYDTGATGTTTLDDTNFGSGTILRFSLTYKIQ